MPGLQWNKRSALLSFKESTPGAYGLKASNAALPISTSIGTSPFPALVVANSAQPVSHPAGIIRAFARDRHVVDVAFAQSRAGDTHELRLLMELGEIAGADISHRGAQTAGELMHHIAYRALVGNLA